jgi:hypothetical protein
VRVSAVERAGLQNLNEGQKISFDVIANRKSGKPAAENFAGSLVWLASVSRAVGTRAPDTLPSPRAEALLAANSFERTPTGFV